MAALELRNESLRLRFVPEIGGTLTDLSARDGSGWLALMRRASEPLERSSNGASFTLAPYSNRLRDGRFRFEGRSHALRGAEKHAIHGDVRDRPWRVARHGPTEALLELDAGALPDLNFPFPFRARVRYALEGTTLRTELEVENSGPSRMPAGGGFHPYFNRALGDRDEAVEIQFRAGGVWPAGDPPLPSGPPVAIPPAQDFSRGRPLDVALDHCFAGWDGAARIVWPKSGMALRMQAGETLRQLIVYSPAGQPFFALEPVVNANDGFNLLAQGVAGTGVVALDPGQVLRADFRLTLER